MHVLKLVSVVKMVTMLECNAEEQLFVVLFLCAKGLNAEDIHKEMLPLYSGKCFSCKAVPKWVKKVYQGHSKVADDA
jgi:hypothetical protein